MLSVRMRPMAIAKINSLGDEILLRGTVRFYQMPGGVLVEADVTGLPPEDSFFGFHIHEGNICTDSGSHFNPIGTYHPNHAGDLPPLLGNHGRAYMSVLTDRFSIRDIIGRTVVIHSQPDDFRTQPAGDSGSKIGCGVITSVK